FNLAGNSVTLRVQGSIANFPTLSDAFIIVSLPDLSQQIDMQTYGLRASGSYEAWLEVDPAQHAALVNHPDIKGLILDDAQAQFRSLHADALSQGTQGAFQLNTLTLALLSVVGFLLVHYFAAQQRVVEFSVLRALGISTRQLLALLSTEGILVISLGLLTGTIIGYGLSQSMVTYLSRALTESLAGVTIRQTLIDWPAVAQLYVVLIVFYALAILLLMGLLIRVGVHRALRMGDE
ncbi:MAG: ABC transporter permease, partial [Chloroflexi bacterium]|nr:ABC transporter permease [Chloroflexota bacterium]